MADDEMQHMNAKEFIGEPQAQEVAGHTPEPTNTPETTNASTDASQDRIATLNLQDWPVADLSRLIATAQEIHRRKADAEKEAFISEARKRAADLGLDLADILGDVSNRSGGKRLAREDDEEEEGDERGQSAGRGWRTAAKPASRTAIGRAKKPTHNPKPKSKSQRRAAPLSIPVQSPAHNGERFRGPNGETWKAQGRGRKPKWLYDLIQQGHSLDEYRVTRGRSGSQDRLAAD